MQVGGGSYDYEQYAFRGDDTFIGSSGDDLFYGSKGNDQIDGGVGSDLLSFIGYAGAVTINMTLQTATSSFGTITFTSIEDIGGSPFADTLTGDNAANQIQGFAGADIINGGGGVDTVVYFDATSTVTVNLATGDVTGGAGADDLTSIERVFGSRFNDTLTGDTGNNFFLGGFGNDTINGGGGVDTAEYGYVGTGVVVDLVAGTTSGGAGVDTLTSIENVKGSLFADTITGNTAANRLEGDAGADKLKGGGGADFLIGGEGRDTLTGGAGADKFVFNVAVNAANRDTIVDFIVADDTIQIDNAFFTAVGANGVLTAAAFWEGAAAHDANDRIIYNATTGALIYDANGNAVGGAIQFATLNAGLTLTAADFVVI